MPYRLAALAAILLSGIAMPAAADMFSPSHSCSKPHKPYQFEDEWDVRRFKNEVEDYKQCIADFVDEQNDEARNHEEAAQEAIDEWNNYVNYELR